MELSTTTTTTTILRLSGLNNIHNSNDTQSFKDSTIWCKFILKWITWITRTWQTTISNYGWRLLINGPKVKYSVTDYMSYYLFHFDNLLLRYTQNVTFCQFKKACWGKLFSTNIQGAPIKNNPLGKILYLWNCSRFVHEIYTEERIQAIYAANFVTIFDFI